MNVTNVVVHQTLYVAKLKDEIYLNLKILFYLLVLIRITCLMFN